MNVLSDQRIAILVQHGVNQHELTDTRDIIEKAGIQTEVVACDGREVKSWEAENWGIRIRVDRHIQEVKPEHYSGLLIPGGPLHADLLRPVGEIQEFVVQLFGAGKLIASMGHGIQVLISAGILTGLKVTAPTSLRSDVQKCGAIFTDEDVVADNGVISCRTEGDAEAFSRLLLDTLRSGISQRTESII